MYKKWVYCARSVCALSCIFSMLLLNTLSVSAATSYYDLFESTSPVDESAQSFSLEFHCEATSRYTDFGGGSYSGTGTYSGSGGSSTTVTGSVSLGGQTSTADGSTIGTISNGFGVLRTFNSTISGQTGSVSLTMPASSGSGSTNSSGSISITTTHGGSMNMHYKIPLMVQLPYVSGGSLTPNDYYGITLYPSNIDNDASSLHHITHFRISSADGTFISDDTARPCYFALGSELLSNSNQFAVVPVFIEFDDFIPRLTGTLGFTSNITFNLTPRLRRIKDSAQSQVGQNITSDIVAHELQEESNAIQEDTNETTHSIFDSITDFFGSFFSNLIGVFVPEEGYFTQWFNRVNTLLTDKLGILYYPFSVIIDIFTRLSTALSDNQNNSCPIYIPELAITIQGQRYVFLERQTIDLIDYNIQLAGADTSNSSMFGLTSLIWVVRRFTSIVLVIAFMNMCVNKVKLILRGSEEG